MSTNRGSIPESSDFRLHSVSFNWKSLLIEFSLRSVPFLMGYLLDLVSREVDDPASPITTGDVEVFKSQASSILK